MFLYSVRHGNTTIQCHDYKEVLNVLKSTQYSSEPVSIKDHRGELVGVPRRSSLVEQVAKALYPEVTDYDLEKYSSTSFELDRLLDETEKIINIFIENGWRP